jgi:hypothetical protein
MKIKALISICKNKGQLRLFDRKGKDGEIVDQWLGTSAAAYPLSGLPYLTEENLCKLFDITEKQRENLYFSHSEVSPKLNYDDLDDGESILDKEAVSLEYGGREIRPMYTSGGLEFIDCDYLTPLADVAGMMELYERMSADGGVYFAAKVGMVLVGIIMPLSIIEERFVERLETLTSKSKIALAAKREAESKKKEADGQIRMEDL